MIKIAEWWMWILKSLYLLLPGLIANMVPPLCKPIGWLKYPIDFGMKWKGKRIFGDHKTFRGFVFGIMFAMLIAGAQKWAYLDHSFFRDFSIINYGDQSAIILGLLLGFGALIGDSIESFFKRRVGIKPGKPWIPFDQLDFVIGSLLFLSIAFIPPWQTIVILLIIVPLLHITTNHIGYYIGVNKSKW